MSVTSIRLAQDVEQPLNALAKKLDRSKNYIINQAIKEYLNKESIENERWEETLTALESVKSGNTIDASEVDKWLGSWGTANKLTMPK